MRTREHIRYGITGPFMNRSVPPNQVAPGSFSELAGVDGRVGGCVRKFFGMKEVVDLDSVDGKIDLYDGPSFIQYVTFHKYGTSTTYRGFVIRWDENNNNNNEAVDLFYTLNGTSWASHEIWSHTSSGITSTTKMGCATDGKFLMVAIDGKATKTVYYNGSDLTTVSSGPGSFATLDSTAVCTADASVVDASYELNGGGKYQVAWRFYDSTRGIYSGLSPALTVSCDNYETTKATGTISFNSGGGDSGLMVAGDFFTINSKKYEYISDNSADVVIAAAAGATIAQHCTALADAINGYSSTGGVTARAGSTTVLLEAVARGSAGNAYTLADDESAGNPDDLTVSAATFTGGGVSTPTPEKHVKVVVNFPGQSVVVSGQVYAGFAALFDTIEVFRTIDLGDSITSGGAIFYKEGEIDKTASWSTSSLFNNLTYTLGTVLDEALPFQTQYNPETDVCSAPPQSGSIGRYQETTFMGQALGIRGGVDTLHSSIEHLSPEYFTTFNDRRADMDEGRPLRYINAGDSMFILSENAVIHAYKASKTAPLQFVKLHQGRGLTGQQAAHVAGNSIFMLTSHGLIILNGADGSMGQVSSVDRLLIDDWANDLGTIESGYDSLLNCSFFLHPGDSEILQLYHSTQSTSMLEGANFKGCTSGPDTVDMADVRCYFITATGRIVVPDVDQSGSGTMWGLTGAVTLNGTTTTLSAAKNHCIDSNATFDGDMKGALLYWTGGGNAGEAVAITNVASGNLTTDAAGSAVAVGDTYSISPMPFKMRLWPLRDPDPREAGDAFRRWQVTGVSLKSRKHVGFVGSDDELVTGGDFSSWSSDDPVGWTVSGESSNDPEISEAATGEAHADTPTTGGGMCNIYTSDGTTVSMSQNITVVTGRKYRFSINIDTVKLGGLKITEGGTTWPEKNYTTTGIKTFTFIANDTTVVLDICRQASVGACDVTFDDVSIKFADNDCDFWRVGFYRNSSSTIDSATTTSTTITLDTNPADSVCHLPIAGIDLEPYIEQISSGTTFELTGAQITVMMVGSRDDADND